MGLRAGLLALAIAGIAAGGTECASITQVKQFINKFWTVLRRSNADILRAAADSKVSGGNSILYVPDDLPLEAIQSDLRRKLTAAEYRKVSVLPLPKEGEPSRPGLLYLPHPYVVPGGRFNEMYGWDSYFILLGLVHDGQLALAKDMTDNLIFEVQHYGKVLNANRSYYVTRSQPPFLASMVLEVFRRTADAKWLASTVPALEAYYVYWTHEPHLTPRTGLSRYDGGADTPAPEVVESEKDIGGRNDYVRIRSFYKSQPVTEYDLARFYDRANDRLTPLFYRADRAMRESGFDPSSRFGPFSAGILDYDPVDLNSLLYRMETDIAKVHEILHQPRETEKWLARAKTRAEAINRLMWDEKNGLYFDYDFIQNRRSTYQFLTTFYPLWVGIASREQAAKVAGHINLFERTGGLQTSTHPSGDQWDAPFGWAPLQLIAVQGLRRYGFQEVADRVSVKFLNMVIHDSEKHGTLREKYDVVKGVSDLTAGLKFGYDSNEVGFGWTNAVFLVLYDELSPAGRDLLQRACNGGKN